VTPCCWAILRIYLDKCNMEFSNVLFTHGLLVKHDAQARSYLPMIGVYENSYCNFLATIIVQLLLPLHEYGPYNSTKGKEILDCLTSTAFWRQQLILASRTDTTSKLAPHQMTQALRYRAGRAVGARPKFQKHCNDAWKPLNALVVFLPMQLALFLTVKLREFVEMGGPITDTDIYPHVVISLDDMEQLTSNKQEQAASNKQGTGNGRVFKGSLKLTGPPLWPRDPNTFPLSIPESAQNAISAFCDKRSAYSPKELTSMQAQVNLEPRPMSLKFHLAELPAQIDLSGESGTRYTANKSQSGPFSLHKRLCNDYSRQELARLENIAILSPNAETILTNTVDCAFPLEEPPEKKSRTQGRSTNTDPRYRNPPASSSSNTVWRQSGWDHGWNSTWTGNEWWPKNT